MAYLIPEGTRAVIFDLNGTMVRDGEYQRLAFRQFFANHHLSVDELEYQKKAANRLNREIWPAIMGRPLDGEETEKLAEEKESLYQDAYEGRVTEVPGLSSLIASLRERGLKLGVATTARQESAMFILGALGLSGAFDEIVTGDQVSRGKPDPQIYRLTLSRLGVSANEALAFEDSPQGVGAAVAAGVPVVAVIGDYSEDSVAGLGATCSIRDFREIELPR